MIDHLTPDIFGKKGVILPESTILSIKQKTGSLLFQFFPSFFHFKVKYEQVTLFAEDKKHIYLVLKGSQNKIAKNTFDNQVRSTVSWAYNVVDGTYAVYKRIHFKTARDKQLAANEISCLKDLQDCKYALHLQKVRTYAKERNKTGFFADYYSGGTLTDLINAGRLTEEERLHLMRESVEAIKALHAKGIIHRDLKPSNLMLSNGELKVIDFGFACKKDDRLSTRLKLGTPQYAPPEDFEQEDSPNATISSLESDIFCLAIVLHCIAYNCLPSFSLVVEKNSTTFRKALTDYRTLEPLDGTVRHLLWKMLNPQAELRPDAKDLQIPKTIGAW